MPSKRPGARSRPLCRWLRRPKSWRNSALKTKLFGGSESAAALRASKKVSSRRNFLRAVRKSGSRALKNAPCAFLRVQPAVEAMKGQIDYRKTKEAFNLINGDLARLDDEFVRLMLQAKYGAGICRAIQNLERLRRCKRLPSEETNQLLGFLGIKPATSKRRRSADLTGTPRAGTPRRRAACIPSDSSTSR